MADEKILPGGIRFFDKHAKAPEFVIGTAVISLNELVKFCKDNPALLSEYNGQKQLKLQILRGRDGKIYSTVDTWKPTEKPAAKSEPDWDF